MFWIGWPVLVSPAFSPVASLAGGAMIGLSAVLLLALFGRVAGISGLVSRLLPPCVDGAFTMRIAFVAGLFLAPAAVLAATGHMPLPEISASQATLAVSGLLVGFGTVLGSGCTSGHGVCGLARLSLRSAVATAVFMAAAIVTVTIARHLA